DSFLQTLLQECSQLAIGVCRERAKRAKRINRRGVQTKRPFDRGRVPGVRVQVAQQSRGVKSQDTLRRGDAGHPGDLLSKRIEAALGNEVVGDLAKGINQLRRRLRCLTSRTNGRLHIAGCHSARRLGVQRSWLRRRGGYSLIGTNDTWILRWA